MANKDVFTATLVKEPRDFTIDGETKTAQAGNYVLTDVDGNYTIIDSGKYQSGYADAGTGVAGEVVEVKPKRQAATDEPFAAPQNASVDASGNVVPADTAATTDVTSGKGKAGKAPKNGSASETTGTTPGEQVGPADTGDKGSEENK